ncbi:MAG: carbohydrate-binding family 9-like protein [Armatimonadota bacterium]
MRTIAAPVVVCLAAACHAQDGYDIKVYACPRAEVAVVVDGTLDDPAWERAPLAGRFTYYDRPEPVEPPTQMQLAYDDANLYVGVMCAEPRMDKLTPVAHARDSREVFHGETIEIFVDPDHDHGRYYQFGINAAGSIYDSLRTDPSWSAEVRAAVSLGQDHWSLEVAIPWADMQAAPQTGQVIGLNVCRDRYLGADRQWSNWSQTKANFHDPERFGHAVLSPTAQGLGALEAEYRKGARSGPVVFLGPTGLVQTAYRELVSGALAQAGTMLDGVEAELGQESEAGAREELVRRIADYRAEVAGFAAVAASEQVMPPDRWIEMTRRLGELRVELERISWEARLAALLASI